MLCFNSDSIYVTFDFMLIQRGLEFEKSILFVGITTFFPNRSHFHNFQCIFMYHIWKKIHYPIQFATNACQYFQNCALRSLLKMGHLMETPCLWQWNNKTKILRACIRENKNPRYGKNAQPRKNMSVGEKKLVLQYVRKRLSSSRKCIRLQASCLLLSNVSLKQPVPRERYVYSTGVFFSIIMPV